LFVGPATDQDSVDRMRQIYCPLRFKLGHREIQIRPLGVELGQYPNFREGLGDDPLVAAFA
jgi:hypothetical protein